MKNLFKILLISVFVIFTYSCKHSDYPKTAVKDNNNNGINDEGLDRSVPAASEEDIKATSNAVDTASVYLSGDKGPKEAGKFNNVTYLIFTLKSTDKKSIVPTNGTSKVDVSKFVFDDIGVLVNTKDGLLARAKQNNKWGYISETNEVKIPMQYESAYMFQKWNNDCVFLGSDPIAIVGQDGKYVFIKSDGSSVDTDTLGFEYFPIGKNAGFIIKEFKDYNYFHTEHSCTVYSYGSNMIATVNSYSSVGDNSRPPKSGETCNNLQTKDFDFVIQSREYLDPKTNTFSRDTNISTNRCNDLRKFIEKYKDTKMKFGISPQNGGPIVDCTYSVKK